MLLDFAVLGKSKFESEICGYSSQTNVSYHFNEKRYFVCICILKMYVKFLKNTIVKNILEKFWTFNSIFEYGPWKCNMASYTFRDRNCIAVLEKQNNNRAISTTVPPQPICFHHWGITWEAKRTKERPLLNNKKKVQLLIY